MNADVFKKIFLPYHPKLYRIAYRIVQDSMDAEDLVQETFIRLWTKREELENVSNTEGFAIITLKNICMDFLRKTKDNYHVDYDKDIPERISLSTQIEEKDQVDLINIIMNQLPDQQRQVLQLKHWDGYSDQEIEQITGLTRGNIKVILSRVRKVIREQFLKLEER